MLFKFAWRNIWRNKIRSLLTLAAISFATAILVFFIGLQQSSYQTMITANTALFHGHLQIQDQDYFDRYDIRRGFKLSGEVEQRISSLPEIEVYSKRAQGFGIASVDNRSFAAQIIGVDPQLEPEISTLPGVVRSGEFLTTNSYHAFIGKDLAKNLQAHIGDELTFLGQTKEGSVAAAVFEIVGIFESGSRDIDRATIEIPLAIFDEVFEMEQSIHSYIFRVRDMSLLDQARKKIGLLIADQSTLEVYNWEQLIPGLRQAIQLDMAAGWLFFLSLVVIVSFSVVNTFLMSVLERTREFGVILALGEKPIGIGKLIVIECLLLSSVGIILGTLIGLVFIIYFGFAGFYIPGSEEIMKAWNIPAVLYPTVSISAVLQGPAIIFGSTIAAVIYPLIKVLKLEAIEALNSR